ncbi:MAG: hypothetical protein PHP54_06270 [Clostridia bacterium]|nr:hypothetical protein [Clostridia bacterium]
MDRELCKNNEKVYLDNNAKMTIVNDLMKMTGHRLDGGIIKKLISTGKHADITKLFEETQVATISFVKGRKFNLDVMDEEYYISAITSINDSMIRKQQNILKWLNQQPVEIRYLYFIRRYVKNLIEAIETNDEKNSLSKKDCMFYIRKMNSSSKILTSEEIDNLYNQSVDEIQGVLLNKFLKPASDNYDLSLSETPIKEDAGTKTHKKIIEEYEAHLVPVKDQKYYYQDPEKTPKEEDIKKLKDDIFENGLQILDKVIKHIDLETYFTPNIVLSIIENKSNHFKKRIYETFIHYKITQGSRGEETLYEPLNKDDFRIDKSLNALINIGCKQSMIDSIYEEFLKGRVNIEITNIAYDLLESLERDLSSAFSKKLLAQLPAKVIWGKYKNKKCKTNEIELVPFDKKFRSVIEPYKYKFLLNVNEKLGADTLVKIFDSLHLANDIHNMANIAKEIEGELSAEQIEKIVNDVLEEKSKEKENEKRQNKIRKLINLIFK